MDRKIDNQKSQTKLTGYKTTELGPLPQEWKVVMLGEVAEILSGGGAPQGENYFNGDKPFIRVSHIDNEDSIIKYYDLITQEAVKDYKLKLFPKGTIVFPKSGATIYLEKRAMLPVDAYIVSHLCAVISNNVNHIQEFLFYALKSKKMAKEKAEDYPTLNLSEIKEIKIPLPPLPEQRKIAAILSTVQKAIEIEGKLIERTKELKKSMMHKLFTEGIPRQARNGARSEKQKITEIGPIPESWEVVKLGEGDILKSTQYGLSIKGQKKGKYPILRMNNLVDGLVSTSDLQFVNIDEKTFKKFKLEKGDILFNRTNSFELVGKTSIFTSEGDFVFASYLIRLKVNSDIIDHFFFNLYFNWDKTQIRLKSLASRGVSQANISATKLKTFKIPLPTLPEQQAIASILSIIDQKIEHHTTKKQKLEELFRTLLHVLMTARVRVDKINLDFLNEKKGEIYDNT